MIENEIEYDNAKFLLQHLRQQQKNLVSFIDFADLIAYIERDIKEYDRMASDPARKNTTFFLQRMQLPAPLK